MATGWLLGIGAVGWTAIQTGAIIFAGAIYLRYTQETIRLREAADSQINISQRQLEISLQQSETMLRPVVVAVTPDKAGIISLKNVGHGPALNVRVLTTITGEESGIEFSYRYPVGIIAIAQNAVETVKVEQWLGDVHSRDSVVDLRPEQREFVVRIKIEYSSVHRHLYLTQMLLSSHGYELAGTSELPFQFMPDETPGEVGA